MADFKELRKRLDAYEAEAEGDEGSEEDSEDGPLAGFLMPISGWREELNDFSIAAPLSIGAGILLALGFDAVKSKGDESSQIFEGSWRTMAILTGSLLFGWGAGKLSRGTVAQAEAEYHEQIIAKAEEKVKKVGEAEEKKAEAGKQNAYNILTDPASFKLAAPGGNLNVFGEYGSAIGQSQLSYQYMG